MPAGSKEFKEPSVTTDTVYMDDIIFNPTRIGPTYFNLLIGNSITLDPEGTQSFRISAGGSHTLTIDQ